MNNQTHLIYETHNASIEQCDRSEKFLVNLFGEELQMSVCSLIAFRKKIKDLDIQPLLESSHPGIELIWLPYCDRFFAFSLEEIIELRDLLAGTFTMLELNSLIINRLNRITL